MHFGGNEQWGIYETRVSGQRIGVKGVGVEGKLGSGGGQRSWGREDGVRSWSQEEVGVDEGWGRGLRGWGSLGWRSCGWGS